MASRRRGWHGLQEKLSRPRYPSDERIWARATVPPELRGHRSEAELDCPDLRALAEAIILNAKRGWPALANQGRLLRQWGWA